MPTRAQTRPGTRQGLIGTQAVSNEEIGDPVADRVIGVITEAVQRLEEAARNRSVMIVDLVIGDNRMRHLLGKRPRHCHITPTVCSAAFAYAITAADDVLVTITVVGADQPGAGLIFE